LKIPVNSSSDLEAVAVLDNRVVLFEKGRGIWTFSGEGQNAFGVGRFSTVTQIASDVGCTDYRSVKETKDGILFKSIKGWYMLNRAFQTEYIGAGIEDSNNEAVGSVENLEDEREYRILLNEVSTAAIKVWDAHHKAWYTDDLSGLGDASNVQLIDSCIWNGHYIIALDESTGSNPITTYKEESPRATEGISQSYTEGDGTEYTWRAKTGWIRPAGINGYVRCRRVALLGEWKTSHTLTMKVYTLEDPTTAAVTRTFTLSSDSTPYQYRVRLPTNKQKTSGIMVEILIDTTGTVTESATWNGVSLEVGIKKGTRKLGSTRSA